MGSFFSVGQVPASFSHLSTTAKSSSETQHRQNGQCRWLRHGDDDEANVFKRRDSGLAQESRFVT